MRIKSIEINNYRGLYGQYTIDLNNSCKNLILYGENGSGKSSLCNALQAFISSSTSETHIGKQKNIFVSERFTTSIKVRFRDSNNNDTEYILNSNIQKIEADFLRETNKIKGILSYKNLFHVHHVPASRYGSIEVNLFNLLIENLLSDMPSSLHGRTIGQIWSQMNSDLDKRRDSLQFRSLLNRLKRFNADFSTLLRDIQAKANEIIQDFGYAIDAKLRFKDITLNETSKSLQERKILLSIDFHGTNIPQHHTFLNEARLTALAVAIYFASILVMPQGTVYKILILDDILIGLDMSNRMPLLNILEKYFNKYQIFMSTHDKRWYEALRLTLDHSKWQFAEMYTKKHHQNGFDVPVLKCGDQVDFITTAENYLNEGDFKAAAIYLRTAFEQILARYCNKEHLLVRFSIKPSKITSEDLWQAVERTDVIEKDLCDKFQSCRALVMNPFSHYNIHKPLFRSELENAITVTKELNSKLS